MYRSFWLCVRRKSRKPKRFASREEGEQRPLVLCQPPPKEWPQEYCGDRVERPAGLKVLGKCFLIPARSLSNPLSRSVNHGLPAAQPWSVTLALESRRCQPNDLVTRFTKGKFAESALYFGPFVALYCSKMTRVLVKRLVQHGEHHKRGAITSSGGFGQGLKQIYVAPTRLLGCIFQQLTRLVDDKEQAGSLLPLYILRRVFKALNNLAGRAPPDGR